MKSGSSSPTRISLAEKIKYYTDILAIYSAKRGRPKIDHLDRDYESVDSYCRKLLGKPFNELTAVEIGFGPRPYRAYYFAARGVNLYAMDLDQPVLHGSLVEILAIAKRNGLLRALKSAVRFWLFDNADRAEFVDEMRKIRPGYALPFERLVVGDAAALETWENIPTPQVIYSYLVVMHIPPTALKLLIDFLAEKIDQDGMIYLTITIYTGLIGNQLVEWYPVNVDKPGKTSEPWEHLRKNRYRADTYLNKLSRRDFVNAFSEKFHILVDESLQPGLGSQYLTEDVRKELSSYDEYELLSNNILLVMKPRQ